MNRRFAVDITFHDVLNGFWVGHLTGTSDIEAKLLQKITAMREVVLYKVFLDLQKAYDALDWDRCLKIFAAYGVGPRELRILKTYWYRLTMVARSRGYYVPPFKGYFLVTQGDPCPPCYSMWS